MYPSLKDFNRKVPITILKILGIMGDVLDGVVASEATIVRIVTSNMYHEPKIVH